MIKLLAMSLRLLVFAFFCLLLPQFLFAQQPMGGRGGGNPAQYNIGRFYGKVVDETTGKGIGYASVQLTGMKWDSVTHKLQKGLIAGQLTEENGDFSLENLPIRGDFTLKVSYLGFASMEQTVTFGIPGGGPGGQGGDAPGKGGPGGRPANGGQGGRPGMPSASAIDKDLGNIKLSASSELLKEVTIEGHGGQITLALDKKVYHVDKDGVAAGGTAEDALKNIPSLNVDVDGNLTMRNAAPQIFVDGRPTNMTIDQIPADAIDKVELITNPSAKYDASGGGGGIVNIVLKKERRIGYNGNIRTGVDMRGRVNLGGDINVREGKVNGFVSGNFNQRRSLSSGATDRYNLVGTPLTNVFQSNQGRNDGFFAMGRAGIDYFISNRNTLTLSGNYTGGSFKSYDQLGTKADTLRNGEAFPGESYRRANTDRAFNNYGAQLLFKHIYPKEGKEFTADVNFNGSTSTNTGDFNTTYYSKNLLALQRQQGTGSNEFVTLQTDYVNPLRNGMKLETGARAAIRNYRSENNSFNYFNGEYLLAPNFASRYKYTDQVYAAYATFSKSYTRWGYQAGLRAESSRYRGVLIDNNARFSNQFPFSLFPSLFLTYKLNEEDNIQLSYSRRINRPNFFQLIPFPDYSDSLNLSRGNPGLRPEFTNSLEVTYQNILNKDNNILVSAYYKRADHLITRYQQLQSDVVQGREVIVATYENANSSTAYGAEFTVKNTLFKIVDLTSNLNLYNSIVDGTNIAANLKAKQFTWFIKENLTVRLPQSVTLQLNGSYQSRTAFSFDNGGGRGGRGGGGGGFGGGPSSTAQGYSNPVWFCDFSVRKDLWKRTASITFSMQDIFRSRISGTHTASTAFIQDSWRRRDARLARVTFTYRFGKFDVSLFRRKNTRTETEGMDF